MTKKPCSTITTVYINPGHLQSHAARRPYRVGLETGITKIRVWYHKQRHLQKLFDKTLSSYDTTTLNHMPLLADNRLAQAWLQKLLTPGSHACSLPSVTQTRLCLLPGHRCLLLAFHNCLLLFSAWRPAPYIILQRSSLFVKQYTAIHHIQLSL